MTCLRCGNLLPSVYCVKTKLLHAFWFFDWKAAKYAISVNMSHYLGIVSNFQSPLITAAFILCIKEDKMTLYISMAICIVLGIGLKWSTIELMLGLLLCISYDIAQSCYIICKRSKNWEEQIKKDKKL